MIHKLFDNLKQLFTFRPASVTATANGTAVDTQGYMDGAVVLEVGAVTGTAPTLDVKMQESDTSGGTYTDITGAVFTQVVASNSSQIIRLAELNVGRKRFIRAVATIAGTGPNFTFGCEVLLGNSFAGAINND